jgi:dTMP kinase
MAKLPESEWQSYLRWLYDYEHEKLGIPKPDLTVFLDVPVEISQRLLAARYAESGGKKDIHEGDVAYLEKCRLAALYAAAYDNQNEWVMLNCVTAGDLKSAEAINKELIKIIESVL